MRIRIQAILFLLAFPVGLLGFIHLLFSFLSLAIFQDHDINPFLFAGIPEILLAITLLFFSSHFESERIGLRDSLLFATSTWFVIGLLGAIPIMLTTSSSFTDSTFESISALTTTGATVLSGLDEMPPTFLLYRQFLQWLGGLGVVIFVVAVLPLLNVGGMKLLKAETPGPIKDQKISPRAMHSAHYLWLVYLVLTFACAAAYKLAGMNTFDAISHSFTTISTGGFSTHDASLGYYQSHTILLVADIFMLLGAISFMLHFRAVRRRQFLAYFHDEETRSFLLLAFCFSVMVAGVLSVWMPENGSGQISHSFFMLISFMTSTGFGAGDYTQWPNPALLLLVIAAYIGGCSGSTAGGNKVIRSVLAFKITRRELHQQIHPDGVFTVKYQHNRVSNDVIHATLAFLSLVLIATTIITLCLIATGLDAWSAFTATAACLNVLGPAFGELGSGFQSVSDTGTWMLSFAMILGRLEYLTVLALFLPGFWRE